MRGFLSDIYLRPSCYACKCKNGVNHSDMTIADFWGINQIAPEFDDDKGVGLVLLNTKKGEEYFSRLPMDMMPSNLEKHIIIMVVSMSIPRRILSVTNSSF